MVFFLFFYAVGIGIVPWLVQSEIFSGDVRGVGGGLATATNWTCNLIISATYLDLVRGKSTIRGQTDFFSDSLYFLFSLQSLHLQAPLVFLLSLAL